MKLHISIPTISYLRDYAIGRQYLLPGDIIDLTSEGEIPFIICSCLEGKTIREQVLGFELDIKKYNAQLTVAVPRRAWHRNKIYFSDFTINWINAWLMKSFKDYIELRVEWGKKYGISETTTLYHIIQNFKMDETITFDAIKKASYRVRHNKGLIKKV